MRWKKDYSREGMGDRRSNVVIFAAPATDKELAEERYWQSKSEVEINVEMERRLAEYWKQKALLHHPVEKSA